MHASAQILPDDDFLDARTLRAIPDQPDLKCVAFRQQNTGGLKEHRDAFFLNETAHKSKAKRSEDLQSRTRFVVSAPRDLQCRNK